MCPDTDLARGVLKVVGNVVLGAGSGETGRSTSEWEYAEKQGFVEENVNILISLILAF